MGNVYIKNLLLDSTNNSIKVSGTVLSSTYQTLAAEQAAAKTQGTYLTDIYGDNHNSFICINDPSSLASEFKLDIKTQQADPSPATFGDDGIYYYTDDAVPTTTSKWKPYKVINYTINLNNVTGGVLSITDLNNDMIFIFIKALSVDGLDTYETCSCKAAYNQEAFDDMIFNIIHNSIIKNECCNRPISGARAALIYEAFQLVWILNDYKKCIYYWNLSHDSVGNNTTNCKCNG